MLPCRFGLGLPVLVPVSCITTQQLTPESQKLQYDGKSLSLQAFEEKVGASGSHELYKVHDQGKENEWSFAGIINYNLVTIQKVEEASAGADKAMEQLRNTQALAKQEIEARKCVALSITERQWCWDARPIVLLTIVTT